MCCPKCGGTIIGDGFTLAEHCENALPESTEAREPDSGPVWCDFMTKEIPKCPDGWFAVYPCGSKKDLCASFEDRAVAFFEHRHQAEELADKYWPDNAEILTSEQAHAKPATQAEEMAYRRTGIKGGKW